MHPEEEQRGRGTGQWQPSPLTSIYPKLCKLQRWICFGCNAERLGEGEGVERGRMGDRRGFERGARVLTAGVSPVYGGLRRKRLAIVGGVWGRRRELGLGDRGKASVAGQFGRSSVGFRE
jgi:hypothetical protein